MKNVTKALNSLYRTRKSPLIKGLKSKVQQVTFVGDKHPTTGKVCTFTWERLKYHVEKTNKKTGLKVLSFKVTPSGINCYMDDEVFGSYEVLL